MEPIVIERLGKINDLSSQSHRRPELPIPAQRQVFVSAANALVHVFPKNNGTGIRHSIATHQVISAFFQAVYTIVGYPSVVLVPNSYKSIYKPFQSIIRRNTHGPAIGKSTSWLGFKSRRNLL
jgi:hypothetical protein